MTEDQNTPWWDGPMENITPNSEKWRNIFDEGWNSAWESLKAQMLFIHEMNSFAVCKVCKVHWPCPTMIIFLPPGLLLPESSDGSPF